MRRTCLALWRLLGKDAASKTLTVQTASKVLLRVLNRFSDFTSDKVGRDVTYLKYRDLQPCTSEPNRRPSGYALYTVMVPVDFTCSRGHFFCFIKAGNGQWYKMDDDSKIARRDMTSALREPACVLVYLQQTDLKKDGATVPVGRVNKALGP